jgi:hypothetical protein
VSQSSPITTLAESQITRSPQDVLSIELIEPDGMPAMVRITWPLQPTVVDPQRFSAAGEAAVKVFAAAVVALARVRRDRRL